MKNSRGIAHFGFLMFCTALLGIVIFFFTAFQPFSYLALFRDAKREKDIRDIQAALESYYAYHGRYPQNPKQGVYKILGLDGTTVDWGSNWPPYLSPLPKDPSFPSHSYVYISSGDGQTYYLYASVESNSKDLCSKGKTCENVPAGVTCGNSVCNFGVSSANTTP